jgi:hypothetical protein
MLGVVDGLPLVSIHGPIVCPAFGLSLRTGHYARIGWNSDDPPRPKLLRAKDRTKDQTYYLSNISEGALQKVQQTQVFALC